MLKASIAVLASGGGTNLQALLDAQARGELKSGEIRLVIADRPGIGAIARAQAAGVACAVAVRREAGFEAQVQELLAQYRLSQERWVEAGFLGILSPAFIRTFGKPILNIHPSLIPSFCGKGFYGLRVHQAALDYGVKVTGATVHLVNEVPDGGKILLQRAVDIRPGDTAETLQRRVMEEAEWKLLPQAVETAAAEIVEEKENLS